LPLEQFLVGGFLDELLEHRARHIKAIDPFTPHLEVLGDHAAGHIERDDDIDAPAIAWAGIGAAPSEAMPAALAAAGFVARRPAGRGAVRDVCEQILAARVHAAPA